MSSDQIIDAERTIPPVKSLRFDRPFDLYRELPEVRGFTKHRPSEEDDAFGFFEQLARSTTPEDALTFTAFATEPLAAIKWGLASTQAVLSDLPPEEEQLLHWVAQWVENPTKENRWRTFQVALFAPRRSASVYLGLAVGWSGGPLAPNDPVTVPAWRTPRAVNTAVLRSIGQVGLQQRSVCMQRVLDLAANHFRVY